MEWLLIVLGICALIALGAKLHQRLTKIDWEDHPVFPCIIEVKDSYYLESIIDGDDHFAVLTTDYKEAMQFYSEDSYSHAVRILRNLGYSPLWKCSPGAFKVAK